MALHLAIHDDPASNARAVTEQLDSWGRDALAARERFVVSLAGGSTPPEIYRLWAETSQLDWPRVDFLYGDERCVPPDHADSNHGMVRAALLERLKAQPRVFPMAGENPDPTAAARDYEQVVRDVLGDDGRIDVALLGIGGDGHTASLFPDGIALNKAALDETERRCVANRAPDGSDRLTLTFPELRRARRLMFLAVGEGKAAILQEILEGPLQPKRLPSQTLLRDDALECHLFCDRAAVRQLKSTE